MSAKDNNTKETSAKNTKKTTEKSFLKRIWYFLWYEDSLASWLVSIIVAFIFIKFLLYPALGLIFGTQFPVVAVVSDSMEHDGSLDEWWATQEDLYLQYNITKQEFSTFSMPGGFNKGDIIVLLGAEPDKLKRGEIIVYWGGKEYPIIHRVVQIENNDDGSIYFQTKGDHNRGQIINPPYLDERHVSADTLVGKAFLRIPYLGWVKIGFVWMLNKIGIPVA